MTPGISTLALNLLSEFGEVTVHGMLARMCGQKTESLPVKRMDEL